MDDKQRESMRNSFKRTSATMAVAGVPLSLSTADIEALGSVGFAAPADLYRPVSTDEARKLLEEICGSYSRSKLESYLEDAQHRVMEAIIRPFGLAKVIFEDDATSKSGARSGSEQTHHYDPSAYRSSRYQGVAKEMVEERTIDDGIHHMEHPWDYFQSSPEDYVVDDYSGLEVHPSLIDVDHIYPASTFDKQGGHLLTAEQKADFGADRQNLALTHRSGNRSLGSLDKKSWQEKQATNGSGLSNKEAYGHDNRRVNSALKRGGEAAKRHLDHSGMKGGGSGDQVGVHGRAAAADGAKMGLQQSMGIFLMELARAMWDEVRDVLATGTFAKDDHQSLMSAIIERLTRVGQRVISKWKEMVVAFRDGAISGFLSSIVTTLIKMFMTTATNVVRMIREGFMSLVRGFKFILAPPEGFTMAEAYHESGKLIIGGIAVGLGICAEEAVKAAITAIPLLGPLIQPFADNITPVLVGIAVGLGTSFLCYIWDKLDLFGAEEVRRHKFIMDTLDSIRRASTAAADSAVAERSVLIEECDRMLAQIEQTTREFWELASSR